MENKIHNLTHDVNDLYPQQQLTQQAVSFPLHSAPDENAPSSTVPIPISSSSPNSSYQPRQRQQRPQIFNSNMNVTPSNQNFLIQHNEAPKQGRGGMRSSNVDKWSGWSLDPVDFVEYE